MSAAHTGKRRFLRRLEFQNHDRHDHREDRVGVGRQSLDGRLCIPHSCSVEWSRRAFAAGRVARRFKRRRRPTASLCRRYSLPTHTNFALALSTFCAHGNRLLATAAFILLVPVSHAIAQDSSWQSIVEANASMLFGASSQTLTTAAGSVSHSGDGFSADASLRFRYGESEDAAQTKFVSARGWGATVSADITPNSRLVPFFFASTEASLEKRIDNRTAGGAGAKWIFAKSNTGAASISLALLAERTTALSDTVIPVKEVARWSWRVKTQHKVGDRLSVSHVTFYAPIVDAPAQYTITSTSVGAYSISKSIALTLTFTDNYDSQAVARGARTNNDGALLFGFRNTF